MAVAPLVGAWIEIVMRQRLSYKLGSLLSWERGLKFDAIAVGIVSGMSLLSWERGLKFNNGKQRKRLSRSLLSWERGLK